MGAPNPESSPQPRRNFTVAHPSTARGRYGVAVVEKIEGHLDAARDAASFKPHGLVQLTIYVRADGSLEGVEVHRPSADEALNAAAVRAVEEAAPFEPFPEELRESTDVLSVFHSFSSTRPPDPLELTARFSAATARATTYRLTAVGRIQEAGMAAVAFYVVGRIFFDAAPHRYYSGNPITAVEWLFIVPAMSIFLVMAASCAIRALGSGVRVAVDEEGLTYRGLFRERRVAWSEIRAVSIPFDPYGGWGAVRLKTDANGVKGKLTVNMAGVLPGRRVLVEEIQRRVPEAKIPRGWRTLTEL